MKYWYPTRPGKCVGAKVRDGINYYTTGKPGAQDVNECRLLFRIGFMIFCDLVLATLPIGFLWSVHISRKVKVYVCIIMALGLL